MTSVVTIFGSSHIKNGEPEYQKALELGMVLAKVGYIVCNGGYGGVMEASARGAKEAGGRTIGVTTGDFESPANLWIDEEIRMKKWTKRLFKLIELGDAYVVFDGGTGTLVELFMVWEMLNKELITKPLIVFGKVLKEMVRQIGEWPSVIPNRKIFFASEAKEVLEFLK